MTQESTNTSTDTNKAIQNSSKQDVSEADINTDGRKAYDWKSRYPEEARIEMRWEAVYIAAVLIISIIGLFSNWRNPGCPCLELSPEKATIFEEIAFYFFSGLLGGTIFGMKYFYRVVARGYWTQDRRYWRMFSPWIASCIALIVGCMVISGYINMERTPSTAAEICVGFISGYFADQAVGKMSEVATALFGSNSKTK